MQKFTCSLHTPSHKIMLKNWKLFPYSFFSFVISLFLSSFLQPILHQHGDMEMDHGPRKTESNSFSCCHQNVSSLISCKMAKLLISPYLLMTKIQLDGHYLTRADHVSNTKVGGVGLFLSTARSLWSLCEVSIQIKRIYCC